MESSASSATNTEEKEPRRSKVRAVSTQVQQLLAVGDHLDD